MALCVKEGYDGVVAANPGCDFVQDLERRNLMVNYIRAMKEAGLGDRTQNNLFGCPFERASSVWVFLGSAS
jgi:hypothetical protein